MEVEKGIMDIGIEEKEDDTSAMKKTKNLKDHEYKWADMSDEDTVFQDNTDGNEDTSDQWKTVEGKNKKQKTKRTVLRRLSF